MNEVEIVVKVKDETAAGYKKAESGSKSFADRAGGNVKKFADMAKTGGLVAGAALAKLGFDAVNAAADAEQSLGGTQAVFGKYADTVIKKSKGAAEAYGLSANDYRESANLIGASLKNQGVASDQLGGKTDNLIKLGADLSATYGGTAKEAVEAMGSAFKGEFDPLDKYGISMSAAAVSAEALRVAGVKTSKAFDELTPKQQAQAKQQATTNLLLKQSGDAQGQFAAQTSTVSEKVQIVKAKFADLSAQMGEKLLPTVANLLDKGGQLLDWLSKNPAAVQAVVVAVAALAAGFVALGVAMLANPFSLIAIGLVALGAAFVAAWKKSQTFREVVSEAFSVLATVFLTNIQIMIKGIHLLLNAWMSAVSGILHATAKIPGPTQDAAKKAAKSFDEFKHGVDRSLTAAENKISDWKRSVNNMPKVIKLQGNINDLRAKVDAARAKLRTVPASRKARINADIAQLSRQIRIAQDKINQLHGKTVVTTLVIQERREAAGRGRNVPGMAHGGIVGAAATGGARGGYTMVGEYGREMVQLPYGSRVIPHGTTEAMMSRAGNGGGGGPVTLEVHSSGSRMDDMLAELIRKYVRVRGGNVQTAFGSR